MYNPKVELDLDFKSQIKHTLMVVVYMFAGHPWVQVGGEAPDRPLDSAVLTRLKQFSAMNRLKKIAIRVSLLRSHAFKET